MRAQIVDRLLEGAGTVPVVEGVALRAGVGRVLVGRDQLVLGARDQIGEAAERGHRVPGEVVVEELAHVRQQVAQQQSLTHLVEQLRITGDVGFGAMLAQQPVAEAVEVVHPQAAGHVHAEGLLEALDQLALRLARCR